MQTYTKTAKLFHWASALLIIAAFWLGVTMVDIAGISPTKLRYFSWHKWLGVTILGLSCLRLLWRLTHRAPAYPVNMQRWQQLTASGLHLLLYGLVIGIPLSGYLYTLAAGYPVVYLGIIPLPVIIDPNPELKILLKQVHYWLNMTLLACFILHITAALKHHFFDRDDILKRMLP